MVVLLDDGLAKLGASGPVGDGLPGMGLVIGGVITVQIHPVVIWVDLGAGGPVESFDARYKLETALARSRSGFCWPPRPPWLSSPAPPAAAAQPGAAVLPFSSSPAPSAAAPSVAAGPSPSAAAPSRPGAAPAPPPGAAPARCSASLLASAAFRSRSRSRRRSCALLHQLLGLGRLPQPLLLRRQPPLLRAAPPASWPRSPSAALLLPLPPPLLRAAPPASWSRPPSAAALAPTPSASAAAPGGASPPPPAF